MSTDALTDTWLMSARARLLCRSHAVRSGSPEQLFSGGSSGHGLQGRTQDPLVAGDSAKKENAAQRAPRIEGR